MSEKRKLPVRVLALASVACALAAVLLVSGCSSLFKKPVDPAQDRRAMMETVANWYVAVGAKNLAGQKAAVYDPGNVLGLATATPAPAGAPRTAFSWRWSGDSIVMSPPSQSTTYTLTNSAVAPATVDLRDLSGRGFVLIMIKVNDVWKIDAAESAKASAAAAGRSQPATAPPGSGTKP